MVCILTIEKYLRGKVRGVTIPDDSLLSICADAGVEPTTAYRDATQKQKDLATAYLYKWLASPLLQTGGYTEENADWKSSESGERYSAAMLQKYLDMANEIFDAYDLPVLGVEKWGFVGRGIHNPRRYR